MTMPPDRRWLTPARALLLCLCAASFGGWEIPAALAQGAAGERLIDQPAYDLLTLDKANDNKVLKIYPVTLPGRRVPEKPKGSDLLRIRLLDSGEEFDVAWSNIAKLELYEGLVLAEANKLTSQGQFDAAYEYLTFLHHFFPQTPGLADARQSFLYLSAGASFRQRKYEEALAVLEELIGLNPSYRAGENSPPLLAVLGNIADPLLNEYFSRRDFSGLRALLLRLAQKYRADNEAFVRKWRQQLTELAAAERDKAQAAVAADKFLEAYEACRAMQNIWPDLPGAAELSAEVARRHPLVTVGVEAPAVVYDSRSLANVAGRRAGRLMERLLVEMIGLGPEGGKYDCPLAALSRSDDGLALLFKLPEASGGNAASDLIQRLLQRGRPGNPDFNVLWARLLLGVRLQAVGEVRAELRAPHVLPEALLQSPLLSGAAESGRSSFSPYLVHSRDAALTRFAANPQYALRRAGQPAEIIERFYEDPLKAIAALRQGEIDVLDRVFPGDLGLLADQANIAVMPYQAPTSHVLAVRSEHPFLANRTFRRALLYGANRELLLGQGILRGKARPGFRVVSAPFPAPYTGGNVPAYAYDPRVEPRPYDPRLALTLRLVAENEIKTESQQKKAGVPSLGPIVLGHPADEVSRVACRGLVRQWKLIGIECKLQEFPPGVYDDAQDSCDLVYLQLAAWEPVVDAGRLFGAEGLIPAASPYIQLALRQIEAARNWQEAREHLLQLHRLLHEEVALLPLWQTLDHCAYRKSLQGLSGRPLRLYQEVEQWQAPTQLAGVGP